MVPVKGLVSLQLRLQGTDLALALGEALLTDAAEAALLLAGLFLRDLEAGNFPGLVINRLLQGLKLHLGLAADPLTLGAIIGGW